MLAFLALVAHLTTLLAAPATAQVANEPVADPPPRSDPGAVFSLGGGIGSQGMAGILSVGIPVGPGELVLRGGGTTSTDILGTADTTGDLGVLYGVRKAGAQGWTRLAGGVGLMFEDSPVPHEGPCDNWLFGCGSDTETRTRAGLLGQADAVWAFTPNFGLGATLYGGVGLGGASYGALSIGLFIGRGGITESR